MYIRPENRDTRYALWFERYDIRIPYIQTKTVEELEQHGLHTSGDRHHDHAMQWEPILKSLPIHAIADLWHNGANVSLVSAADAPVIYQAIQKHLHAWKNHIENSYHPNTPPAEDLITLDQFAHLIYEHARFAFDTTFINEHFKISSSTSIGRRAILSAMSKASDRRLEEEERGMLAPRNIEYIEAAPKYNPDIPHNFVDYSGRNVESNAPNRESMSKFFRPESKVTR